MAFTTAVLPQAPVTHSYIRTFIQSSKKLVKQKLEKMKQPENEVTRKLNSRKCNIMSSLTCNHLFKHEGISGKVNMTGQACQCRNASDQVCWHAYVPCSSLRHQNMPRILQPFQGIAWKNRRRQGSNLQIAGIVGFKKHIGQKLFECFWSSKNIFSPCILH